MTRRKQTRVRGNAWALLGQGRCCRLYCHGQVLGLVFAVCGCDRPIFSGLGDLAGGEFASHATAVDDNGRVVVGWSETDEGEQAFRWSPGSGLEALPGEGSRAHDVSPDGTQVAGRVATPEEPEDQVAVVWSDDDSFRVLGGFPEPEAPFTFFMWDATVALNTGSAYGNCVQRGAYGDLLGTYADVSGDFDLVNLGSGRSGYINDADASGFFVGERIPPNHHHDGSWGSVAVASDGVELGYPQGTGCFVPHDCRSAAWAFSADHSVIVGTSVVPLPCGGPICPGPLYDTAFVYTAGEGMLGLPDIEGGEEASGAYTVDASGRVIGGFGTTSGGRRAVVWVDRPPRLLHDVVLDQGGRIPYGWVLLEITAMTPDGLVLAGNGTNASGHPEAFHVVLVDSF